MAYLRGLVGDSFDKLDLDSIRENYGDYTIEGAKEKADRDEQIQRYVSASTVVDEVEEDPANAMVKEVIEQLKSFGYSDQKIANIIKGSGIDIERPTSEGITRLRRELEAERKRAEELQAKIKELEEARLPPEHGRKATPDEVENLYNEFHLAFTSRLGREPKTNEYNSFVSCVEAAPTFGQARMECKRIVDLFAPPGNEPTPTPGMKVSEPAPGWFEHWALQAGFRAERERYLAERPEPAEAPFMLLVNNTKTGSTQRIKFWSQESMDDYIKLISKAKVYQYQPIRGGKEGMGGI